MSLPTIIVGAGCVAQVIMLNTLIAPMPFKLRKSYLGFLMKSKTVARVVYFTKIYSVFVIILFIDAFRTAYIVTMRPETEAFNSSLDGGDSAMTASAGSSARKLLAERNMSITGASLFTTFLLYRVYELNMDNVRTGEQLAKLQGDDTGPAIDSDRAVFKTHYDKTKPDHEKATRNRNIDNKDVPVPDNDQVGKSTTTGTSSRRTEL